MSRSSNAEIGQRLFTSGRLEEFEKAVKSDDSMAVVMILQEVGVGNETISRMLLQLDKEYVLALIDAGREAGG